MLGYGIAECNWHVPSELATLATARQTVSPIQPQSSNDKNLSPNDGFELSRCIDGKSLGKLWRLRAHRSIHESNMAMILQ